MDSRYSQSYDTVPSIEIGYENCEMTPMAHWNAQSNTPEYNFVNRPSSPYSTSNTPAAQSPELGPSSRRESPRSSPRERPLSWTGTESEEERRKARKREQNRESQRNFRRRQENRVKFLEGKTLELEASSRQLRAENERLKTELAQAHRKNDELVAVLSLPPTPLSMPLELEDDITSNHGCYSVMPSPPTMQLPLVLDEDQFFALPLHNSAW